MHHDHHETTHDPKALEVRRKLTVVFFLNFFFTVIEFIGGILTNSIAIISDAIHDLGDTIAIGSALFLEKISAKGRTPKYSYGYKRYSTLGALITSVILLAGSLIIIYEAIPRILAPQPVIAAGMMWMAILGIVFNGVAVLRLKGTNESLNSRAVMIHLFEDVLGWVAILAGSVVIKFTGWYWIDPVLSIAVAGFIIFNVIKNFDGILGIFLQTTPKGINPKKLQDALLAIEDVIEVHDMHVWSLDGSYHVMSVHLVVPLNINHNKQSELRNIANSIAREHGINHPTIAIEFNDRDCFQCK